MSSAQKLTQIAPATLTYDRNTTDRIATELRSGAAMVKWAVVLLNAGGFTALGTFAVGGYGWAVGLIFGLFVGMLAGGVAAAALEWMAQVLIGQRELLDSE